MELLLWLEQVYLWRLQREHGQTKQERLESEDDELPVASYPKEYTNEDYARCHPVAGNPYIRSA